MSNPQEIRVLVVDDSPHNLQGVTELLRFQGYHVECAHNGMAALSAVDSFAPDIVLLDVVMPGMDGLEVLRALRGRLEDCVVIVMTGHESLDHAREAMALGASGYVGKPVRWETLENYLNGAIARLQTRKQQKHNARELNNTVETQNQHLLQVLEEMHKQGERMDCIVNGMSDGLVALDRSGRITMLNRRAEDFLGKKFSECAGEKLCSSVSGNVLVEQLRELCRSEETNRTVSFNHEGIRHYRIQLSRMDARNESDIGTVILISDQTDRMELEHFRGTFLSNVAHELRTPVNIVLNYARVLELHSEERTEIREIAHDLEIDGRRLRYLINNFVNVARLSEATASVCCRPTDILKLLRYHIDASRERAEEKGVVVEFESEMESAVVRTDPHLMETAFSALLDNAVRYNRSGGTVTIEFTCDDDLENGWFHVVICNQGEGLPEELQIPQIGRTVMRREARGAGTGLYLASRAVELLGGSLELGRDGRMGTCVRMSIPQHSTSRDIGQMYATC